MAEADFAVRRETRGTVAVLRVLGSLEFGTAPLLKAAVQEALGGEVTSLAFDVSQAPYVDSSGVEALLSARRLAQARGGSVVVVGASPALQRQFERLGLSQAIPLISEADLPEP